MLSFQDLGFFVLNLTLRLRPEGVTRILSLSLSLCLLFQRCLRGTPLGYGYWEQKTLQNTTSSVIFVLLLIYGF